MSGQPYVCCDMTSPDATILVRQYQNAVFLPIMRVHQMHGVPRFPFLWCGAQGAAGGGTEEHCEAFRVALNTRYALLPFLYSLAHDANQRLRPIAHPASFEFPEDPKAESSYMVGSSLIPADVCTDHKTSTSENTTVAYLPRPGSTWFLFNTTSTFAGGQTITLHNVPLTSFPVYVRAGSIIPMQKQVVQYSDAIGGLLELQVYSGQDATFTMVEDDGSTLSYRTHGTRRTTVWQWTETNKTLTWSVINSGGYLGSPQDYVRVEAVLYSAGASRPRRSDITDIDNRGKIVF